MSSLTIEKLHTFHAQEREVFSKLVLKFSRPLGESLLVMATWFWLENFGFKDIFSTIMALSDPLIVSLANEAVSCFQCLDSPEPPNDFKKIHLTTRLTTKEISLQIIYKHRYGAIAGIKNFLTTVCSRTFSDIIQRVLLSSSSSSSSFFNKLRSPLIISGFPHPTFGNINVMMTLENNLSSNNLLIFPNGIWKWHANYTATEIERTMFLTFSRGFPVTQVEVKDLFTNKYGENCVQGVYMEEDIKNSPNKEHRIGPQQSLYARLVVDSVATVDRILEDQNLKRFKIYGKHIWVRKFEERI